MIGLAAVAVGKEMGLLDPAVGAGLVAAGLVSVLVFPAVTGWLLFVLGAAGESAVFYHFRTDWAGFAYAAVEAVLIPLIVIGLSRMSDMIVQLHRSRAELSRLAVASTTLHVPLSPGKVIADSES